MKTVLICQDLKEYIATEKTIEGRIHSVFSNACNIETKQNFITLLGRDRQMAPMSAVIDDKAKVNFRRLNLHEGFDVYFSVNDIYCPNCNLLIELGPAEEWSSYISNNYLFVTEQNLLKNIDVLEANLISTGKLQSIGPLFNVISQSYEDLKLFYLKDMSLPKGHEFAARKFLDFFQAAVFGDFDTIALKAKGIIGFGSGLTPSVDDFISGFMSVLICLGHYYDLNVPRILDFNRELIAQGLNSTTKVSSEMLKHSSQGRTNEAVKALLKAIVSEKEEENIIKALINTINFGETSGSDTALGIYAGCRLLTNFKYRRVWINEAMCGD